jgi:hypothetical protein
MRVVNSNSTNCLHNKLDNSNYLELSQLSKISKSIKELRSAIEELKTNKPVEQDLELDSKLESDHSPKGGITSSDLQGIINIETKIRNFIIEGFKEVFGAVKNLFKEYIIDGKTPLGGATKNK